MNRGVSIFLTLLFLFSFAFAFANDNAGKPHKEYFGRWGSSFKLDVNGAENSALFWTYLRTKQYEAGLYKAGSAWWAYGGVDFFTAPWRLQAGFLFRNIFEDFILSPAFFPEPLLSKTGFPQFDFTLSSHIQSAFTPSGLKSPDERPLGLGLGLYTPHFYIVAGCYTRPNKDENKINFLQNNILLAESGFSGQWGVFLGQVNIDAAFTNFGQDKKSKKSKNPDSFQPFFVLTAKIKSWAGIKFIYSKPQVWLGQLDLQVRGLQGGFRVTSGQSQSPFAAKIYNENSRYYFYFSYLWLRFYGYDKNGQWYFHLRLAKNNPDQLKLPLSNLGLYGYVRGPVDYTGIFYHDLSQKLSLYGALYWSFQYPVWSASLGFTYGPWLMFSFVFCRNTSGEYFPLDPEAYPQKIWAGQWDTSGYFNSYSGFAMYGNWQGFFAYLSVLQNYADKNRETFYIVLKLSVSLSF